MPGKVIFFRPTLRDVAAIKNTGQPKESELPGEETPGEESALQRESTAAPKPVFTSNQQPDAAPIGSVPPAEEAEPAAPVSAASQQAGRPVFKPIIPPAEAKRSAMASPEPLASVPVEPVKTAPVEPAPQRPAKPAVSPPTRHPETKKKQASEKQRLQVKPTGSHKAKHSSDTIMMFIIIGILVVVLGYASVLAIRGRSAAALAETPAPTSPIVVQRISVADAKALVDAGDAILVDTRAADYYNRQHAQGAISVPLDEVDKLMNTLPKDKTLILYCT
ncbi:MAG: rhodanese-like domain-containing protein [Anaerolineae bacterium]